MVSVNILPHSKADAYGANKTVAIIPYPALGDTTIYLRLAQALFSAGSSVTVFSDALSPAADLFDWIAVRPLTPCQIDEIASGHDLIIGDIKVKEILAYNSSTGGLAKIPNFVAVTIKAFPDLPQPLPIPEWAAAQLGRSPHQSFCPGQQFGSTMVEWVDRYAWETLGIPAAEAPPPVKTPDNWKPDQDSCRRVLIFPTTLKPSKDYSTRGFKRLSALLEKDGWKVEIVCMPHETVELTRIFGRQRIQTFQSLRSLVLHILQSKAVISNDSGGGHLASMLGVPTFTITKKREDFVWRPGFSDKGQVISPVFTVKWFTGRIWRPFIPLQRIVKALSQLAENQR